MVMSSMPVKTNKDTWKLVFIGGPLDGQERPSPYPVEEWGKQIQDDQGAYVQHRYGFESRDDANRVVVLRYVEGA